MRAPAMPGSRFQLLALRDPDVLRSYIKAPTKNVIVRTAAAANNGEVADGFVAEYDLAGIKLDPLSRRQLRDWYAAELQRASSGAPAAGAPVNGIWPAADGPASKVLPPLMQHRPGVPQLTVLWDLESLKPFTQQHAAAAEGAAAENPEQRQQRARSGPSRLAAAGLLGGASSPDLVRALNELCCTLQCYGAIHAVHLFLRESTLGKAPVLRRQVEQLRTWVVPRAVAETTTGGADESTAEAPGARTQGAAELRVAASSNAAGGRRRALGGLLQSDDVHDCPMCRSVHPSRLALLRHFAEAHQRPLLAATATDARTHIMWTRGRNVGLPLVVPDDLEIRAVKEEGATPREEPTMEKVMVSPEEFAYAREVLMRGRYLDELLASGPVVVHSGVGAASTAAAAADGITMDPAGASRLSSQQPGRAGRAGGVGTLGPGAVPGGGTLPDRGLHLHVVPAGQPAEATAEALRQAAGRLAVQQVPLARTTLPGRTGGRAAGRAAQQGRGRKGGMSGRAEEETPDAAVSCLCLVSDAEGLDQTLADLREQGVLAIAVTRITRVPSANVALRWWAVQGGEYRLTAERRR